VSSSARRPDPSAALIIIGAAFAAFDAAEGNDWVVDVAAVSAFAAGRWARRTPAIVGLLALIGLTLIGAAINDDMAVPYVLVPGLTWIVGRALAERERVARRLAERARELEEEQAAYGELSVRPYGGVAALMSKLGRHPARIVVR
jgi:hypothetical protein